MCIRDRFLAKGYDGTSVPDIERAAKITRGAIFHHFANKEDILDVYKRQLLAILTSIVRFVVV